MNLIKKLQEMRGRKFNRNWQQKEQSLARPQCYVLNSVCNNDCKKNVGTADPKHLVEIKRACSPADFQDAGNQMSTIHEIRIKNANRSIIGHLNINSLLNKFEMLELIKDKIDIFLISETKLDSSFSSGQFVIQGYSALFRLDRNQNGAGLLLYVRKNIPCKILKEYTPEKPIENLFVEINLRSRNWLLSCMFIQSENKFNS